VQIRLESVSAAYFGLLGARPAAGRLFSVDEDRRGVAPAGVAVASHELAVRQFGSPEAAIGRTLTIDGRRLTIVGVLAAPFIGATGPTDVWSPLAAARWLDGSDAEPERLTSRWFEVIGRLASGLGVEEARARFAVEARRGVEQIPNWQSMFSEPVVTLVPLAETRTVARLTAVALAMLAGSGLLVAMAVSSLAGMQAARAADRRREFGVRLALGATRWSLVRLIARDAAVVVAAGLPGALALRGVIIALLLRLMPATPGFGLAAANPFTAPALAFDANLAVVLFGTAAVAWLAMVVLPARAAIRIGAGATPSDTRLVSGGSREAGARMLIVVELAIATVLVIGAGLMARSGWTIAMRDRGFSPAGVLTARLSMPPRGYDASALAAFYEQLATRLRAIPGVRAAGVASCAPGVGRCRQTNVRRVDGVELAQGRHPTVGVHFVTAGLFDTIGAAVIAGRPFDERESAGAPPAAIVSAALAERLWPAQPAVGRRLALFFADGRFTEDREVVGVVRSIEYDAVEVSTPGDVYLPASQAAWSGIIFVRADRAGGRLADAIHDAVTSMDPRVVVFDEATMEQRLAAGLGEELFATITLALYATAALMLAALGVYTMVRVSVARRTRELAIRVAIGGTRGRIARDLAARVVVPATAGIAAGAMAASWLAQALATVLHGVPPRDVLTFAVAIAVLLASVVAAAAGPALRAGRTDPMDALKAPG
jgi:predicted permease